MAGPEDMRSDDAGDNDATHARSGEPNANAHDSAVDGDNTKRAAVRKRGAEREHRDLFASRPMDLGSVKQTLRPGPTETNAVAARNENSVLFTVDALQGAARVKTPQPTQSQSPAALAGMAGSHGASLATENKMIEDDEGIIDLNALASVPPKAGARHIAPLFSEPPPAAFAADVGGTGSSPAFGNAGGISIGGISFGKRAIAGIAAAAVAVVLGGIGIAAAFKGEEPIARTQATMIAPSVATPPAPAAPAAAPAAESKPADPAPASSTASNDEDDEKAAPGKKGKKKRGGAGKAAMSGGHANMSKVKSSGTEGLVSKPASKPAADKCGCHGDFNCILRCTAKGK